MCIRDRKSRQELKRKTAEIEAEKAQLEAQLEHAEVERLKAVSYTHLRAHETVLDLVCRLLLEKKKHKISADNKRHDTTRHKTQPTITDKGQL